MDFYELKELLNRQGVAFKKFKDLNEERLLELEKKVNRPPAPWPGVGSDDYEDRGDINLEHTKAFCDGYVRKGDTAGLVEYQKSMSIGVSADGGYAVPAQLEQQIAALVRENSAMRSICTVKQVGTSEYKKLVNLHGAGSGWVGETDARPETDTPQLEELTPYWGEVYANPQVTQSALEDIFFNVQQFIVDEVGSKFAEDEGAAFVSGDGTNMPMGFLSYTSAATADDSRDFGTLEHMVAASTTDIDPDELIDLIYKLKKKHRKDAVWLLNSLTASYIRKLKDTDGNYLWKQGIREGQPNVLLGHKVAIDENMPDIATGTTPIAFGNWKAGYYIIDRVSTMLRDPFTNKPYVGFYSRKRVGGMVVDSEAIKLLQMAS